MRTTRLLGFEVCLEDPQAIARHCLEEANLRPEPTIVACLNPHLVVVASEDPEYRSALGSASLLLPDGVGVVLAAKLLGLPLHNRVTGSDLFAALNQEMSRAPSPYSVFFLGAGEEALARIRVRLALDHPNIRLAGTYSPPYKAEFEEEDNRRMLAAVNAARPDVLWVGMTAPKQEKWIHRNRAQLSAKVVCAVGAVFDFYAGTVHRAPVAFQRLGLEWLPRLLREPRRLWRRNLNSPLFLLQVLRWRFRRRHF